METVRSWRSMVSVGALVVAGSLSPVAFGPGAVSPVVRAAVSGSCPGDGTTTNLVSGLDSVSGATRASLDRTSPANLVANGDFTTEPAGLGSNQFYFWGVSGRTTKTSTSINAAIPSWGRSGGSPAGTASDQGTYAFWTKQASGDPNTLVAAPSNGQSAGRVYFGNQIAMSVDPIPTFDADGFSMSSYTIRPRKDISVTPNVSYGDSTSPPAIDQSITTEVGTKYRLYWLQSTEAFLTYNGIAAVDITGYPRAYFKVFPSNHDYMLDFVATSTSTNIKFMSWGHLPKLTGNSTIAYTTRSAGGTVTIETAAAHGLSTGDLVAISGVGADYDGSWRSVTVTGSTTFTYVATSGALSRTAAPSGSSVFVYNLPTPSTEFVIDDVIVNSCSAAVTTTTTVAPTTTTTVAPTTTTSQQAVVSVGNRVWKDADRDGVQDTGEPGIAGVTVTITKADGSAVTDVSGKQVSTTTTDANGNYLFANLPPGRYKVSVTTPVGYSPTVSGKGTAATDSSTGSATSANLASNGDSDQTLDFGFVVSPVVSVGNLVWKDVDRDGVQDTGEPGIAGVTVTITKTDGSAVTDVFGNAVTTTITNSKGEYLFANLPPGRYKVSVTTPVGYSPTVSGKGTAATGSSTGSATSANLASNGDSDQTLDFGFVRDAVSVGNRVWKDVDGNGVQGGGEPGIANVVLTITKADGSAVKDVNGNSVKSTKTDANGVYLFRNLPPGSYKVTVVSPPGYSATKTGAGSTARDSSEGNATSEELVKNGDSDQSLDFGFVPPLGGSAPVESAEAPVLSQTGFAPTWFLLVAMCLITLGAASNRIARRRT